MHHIKLFKTNNNNTWRSKEPRHEGGWKQRERKQSTTIKGYIQISNPRNSLNSTNYLRIIPLLLTTMHFPPPAMLLEILAQLFKPKNGKKNN